MFQQESSADWSLPEKRPICLLADWIRAERGVPHQHTTSVKLAYLTILEAKVLTEHPFVVLTEPGRPHLHPIRPCRKFHRDAWDGKASEQWIIHPSDRLALNEMRMRHYFVDSQHRRAGHSFLVQCR